MIIIFFLFSFFSLTPILLRPRDINFFLCVEEEKSMAYYLIEILYTLQLCGATLQDQLLSLQTLCHDLKTSVCFNHILVSTVLTSWGIISLLVIGIAVWRYCSGSYSRPSLIKHPRPKFVPTAEQQCILDKFIATGHAVHNQPCLACYGGPPTFSTSTPYVAVRDSILWIMPNTHHYMQYVQELIVLKYTPKGWASDGYVHETLLTMPQVEAYITAFAEINIHHINQTK